MIKSYNKFNGKLLNEFNLNPFSEENWEEEDNITKKIENSLLEFIDSKGGKHKERIIKEFFPELRTNIGIEKFYEIRKYTESMFDNGVKVGIVKARNKYEAKTIFVLTKNKRDYVDVLFTGYYRSHIIEQNKIDEEIEASKRSLISIQNNIRNLENPLGINDI